MMEGESSRRGAMLMMHAVRSKPPLPSGALQPAFNIYAWNEFGEGGIMAPSNGWRYRRLEAIASVFGVDQAVPTQ